jgi:uncharacterized protein YggE
MARCFTLWIHLTLALGLIAAAAGAQPAGPPPPPQVVAQGTAEVRVPPDRAIVRFGVQFQAREARAAQERVNEVMQRIIQAVRAQNIPENRISTERLELSPVYEAPEPRGGQPRIVGYRASNVVRVELENLTRLGPIIDAAVGAGANIIEGIQFTVANDTAPRLQALRQAAEEGQTKARAMADALRAQLGRLLEIREGGVEFAPPQPVMFERAAMGGAPIQPGEVTVRATVTVRYALQP